MSRLIFGKTWDEIQALQQGDKSRRKVNVNVQGDYGADPLGNGMFRMVPSGDVVDYAERCRRLETIRDPGHN
jgi:hypothetical protein